MSEQSLMNILKYKAPYEIEGVPVSGVFIVEIQDIKALVETDGTKFRIISMFKNMDDIKTIKFEDL